jgi:hypothetical protein
MHSFILIDPQENRCFDFVEHESSASPFPVAYPLIREIINTILSFIKRMMYVDY